jgi:hypothetical protein
VPERSIHLVGSYPADDVRQAMTVAVRKAGRHLRTVADGEVGERRNWVTHIVDSFRCRSDVELRKEGEWSGYDNVLVLKMRRGHWLTADSLDLGHVGDAEASYAVFKEIRAEHELPGLSFQVGIPGDLDLALFTFGPAGAFTRRTPFREELIREINEIAEWGGRDVLFQLEFPVELVMVTSAPAPLRGLVARFMARGMTRLAGAAPPGTRFGIHLCVGDLNHKALKRMKTTAPLVALSNAVLRAWPGDRVLEYMHVPLADGEQPPTLETGFYRDLERLTGMRRDVRFVAGLVHEEQDLDEQRQVLHTVETLLGRTVDVSTACGLGRRTPEDAEQAIARAVAGCGGLPDIAVIDDLGVVAQLTRDPRGAAPRRRRLIPRRRGPVRLDRDGVVVGGVELVEIRLQLRRIDLRTPRDHRLKRRELQQRPGHPVSRHS